MDIVQHLDFLVTSTFVLAGKCSEGSSFLFVVSRCLPDPHYFIYICMRSGFHVTKCVNVVYSKTLKIILHAKQILNETLSTKFVTALRNCGLCFYGNVNTSTLKYWPNAMEKCRVPHPAQRKCVGGSQNHTREWHRMDENC